VRVLVVSKLDSDRPFGQFTRPFFLGRALARRGHEVANVGVDCSRVDYGPAWSVRSESPARFARACALALRRSHPDVVYAHQNMPSVAALLARPRVPLAADFHSLPSLEWSGMLAGAPPREATAYVLKWVKAAVTERLVARRADLVIAAGPEVADGVLARYRPRRPPVTVVNGVDERVLDGAEMPPPGDMQGHGPHLLSILPVASSGANERALAFLVDVTRAVRDRVTAARVHVLGTDSGPSVPGLHYHGVVDVLPWIVHADACLLPYPADAETFGGARNKLLEYLACGRAIVTTENGLIGLREAAGWEGVTVAAGEVRAFAGGIASAIAPGAPRLAEARSLVRRELLWEVLGGRLADVLDELSREKQSHR
jgi:glycosyltransferase involved in cell wall biosynthesis